MSSSSTASSEPSARSSGSAQVYAAVAVGSLVVALAVTEWLLRAYVVPLEASWPHRVHQVYVGEHRDVVLGDSHFYRGFATQDEFLNLAGGGSSPAALEIVAREYFRYREPGRVIVEASPQLFTRRHELDGDQGHERYFGQNHGLPLRLYVFEPGISRRAGRLLDIPGLIRDARLERRRQRPGNAADELLQAKMAGFGPEELRAYTQRVVRKSRPVPDLAASKSYAAYLRLLGLLAGRGAELCLVRTPVTSLFREMVREEADFVAAEAELKSLAAGRGLRYVDTLALDAEFRDEHFIDADHLSASGAALFAQAVIPACFGPRAPGDPGPTP